MGQTHQLTTADIPRLLEELRGKVQSKLRRPIDPDIDFLTTQIEEASLTAPSIEIKPDEWAQYGLTPHETALAYVLKSRLGQQVSIDRIMSGMYGNDRPLDGVVGVFVCKLRHKILTSPYAIETIHGYGYKMVLGAGKPKRKAAPAWRQEWREGIFMGANQAKIADVLFESLGKWVRTPDLARRTGLAVNLYPQVDGTRKNLKNSRFSIQSERRFGYRMLVNA
jgi:hypothetical protein